MNISLITLFTPTKENIKGPSALLYYLMLHRDRNIVIRVFTYNINDIQKREIQQIERELNVSISVLTLPKWYLFITSCKVTKIRLLLQYPLFSYIRPSTVDIKKIVADVPDIIWQYPSSFFELSQKIPSYKHLITGPDCASLTYFRLIRDPNVFNTKWLFWGNMKLLYSSIRMEQSFSSCNVLYHLVGMEDFRLLRRIKPDISMFFLLHPHYALLPHPQIDFSKSKMKILIAGKFDGYTKVGAEDIVSVLCRLSPIIKIQYSITFLGKGWTSSVEKLNNSGFECKEVSWVDNYIESISEYDIQIAPITAGAGTKGKVLDAIGNGLLVIGTKYALENICVRHNDSCVCYKNADEIQYILSDIVSHRQKYQDIAYKGMMQVRTYHASERLSNRFFKIVSDYLNSN